MPTTLPDDHAQPGGRTAVGDASPIVRELRAAPAAARRRVIVAALDAGLIRARLPTAVLGAVRAAVRVAGPAAGRAVLRGWLLLRPAATDRAWGALLRRAANAASAPPHGFTTAQTRRFLAICRDAHRGALTAAVLAA